MILTPRQSGAFISEKAKHVKINNKGIEKLGEYVSINELIFCNHTYSYTLVQVIGKIQYW